MKYILSKKIKIGIILLILSSYNLLAEKITIIVYPGVNVTVDEREDGNIALNYNAGKSVPLKFIVPAENYISVLESSITEMKKTGNRPGYTVLPKLTFQTFSEKFENDLIEYKAELIKMESEFVDENKVSLHSMLWEGINTSNPKLVKKAIKLGVDIDSKQCGSTPLHAAVQKDSYEIVKILLENKADHTIPHHGNTSILGYAKAIGRKKIATLLEKYGAK